MFDRHYSKSFDAELAAVRTRVLEMGGLVDSQLKQAVTAIVEGDLDLAETVIAADQAVNALEVEIDEECIRMIALRAPAAADLRLAITVIKTISDLERIGDEAERVARMVARPEAAGLHPQILAELQVIGDLVRTMLHDALDAFARNDPGQAFETTIQDQAVDARYRELNRLLIRIMEDDPGSIPPGVAALWAARALERIGDRCRNICEYVIYLVGGQDVRHTTVDEMRRAAGEARKRTGAAGADAEQTMKQQSKKGV